MTTFISMFQIFEMLVYSEHARILANNQSCDTPNMLLYKMITLNEAHHRTESQQQRLKQIMTLNPEVSWAEKLLPYFDGEMDIVSICLIILIVLANLMLLFSYDKYKENL